MPKYKVIYQFGTKSVGKALGTLVFKDDDAAVAALRALDTEGTPAELWRPDRKRLLARKLASGQVVSGDELKS
jgi:hypothetical protein